MRIFNWVQRRLNPNNFRESRLGRSNVKKDECVGNGCELESWKDGILTIGTFGYDPLKHFPNHDHHQQLFPEVWTEEEEDVDYDDEEEDDNTNNNNNNVDSGKLDEDDDEEELNPLIFSKPSDEDDEYPISTSVRKNDHSSSADTYDEITKTSRRTTLADLFVAESSSSGELLNDNKLTVALSNHIDVAGEKKKKKKKKETRSSPQYSSGGLPDKSVHSIGAKVEDDDHGSPRPVKIKKLHRLMKKILKKKIYPEDVNGAPVINQKKHVQAAAAQHESLCLLHTGAAGDAMP